MSTPATLTGFAAALALTFGGAWALGSSTGPVAPAAAHGAEHATDPTKEDPMATDTLPAGLAASRAGYTLELGDDALDAGTRELAFTVHDATGAPVTSFDVEHEKRLHLIVVRRDQTGFQHVHPVMDEHGTWRSAIDLTPGSWRVFADFTPTGGPALTLGTDLAVPGTTTPPAPSAPTRTAQVDDGFEVTVTGDLRGGEDSTLRLQVSRDGRPVTDLEPYLGAYGHLVALREGDLAYLHVHPNGAPGDGRTTAGPAVNFTAEVPTAGRYHLYLDFKQGGVVRTAHLVLDAAPAPAGSTPSRTPTGGHGH
ncbi:conserved exported hypothetical protein [Nostocoides japonicum T1-X7]|uniref:Secreted protein n=1 Tax=Nostocoides japonicum T1-X7 TaxID=1194083 RepID=A0A077LVM2_9MICO|nr:hypothetical protein [Tetrasphaera japonica]CCH76867.1 conserved exported hypothetical protein [Tetrasphaera japonica T1-X7]